MIEEKPLCYGHIDNEKTGECGKCKYLTKCYNETFYGVNKK